jgi:hypothetical protein
MDALPICHRAFRRQVFYGIMDLCKITITCKFNIIVSFYLPSSPSYSAVSSLLGALSKFWQILQATVLSSYWTFSKSFLLDIKSLECQCWLDATKKQHMWLFVLRYVYAASLNIQYYTLKCHVQGIDFLYNVQHDCPVSKCTASGKQPLMQERVESGLSQTYIEHQPIERFVVNTHAFHNAHLLRAALPRSLVAPIPLHPDRQAKHFEIAGGLRVTQEARRKARATQKKNEAINPANNTGPGPNKRKRLEEEEDLDEAVMV